jgi:hypothetical protein
MNPEYWLISRVLLLTLLMDVSPAFTNKPFHI